MKVDDAFLTPDEVQKRRKAEEKARLAAQLRVAQIANQPEDDGSGDAAWLAAFMGEHPADSGFSPPETDQTPPPATPGPGHRKIVEAESPQERPVTAEEEAAAERTAEQGIEREAETGITAEHRPEVNFSALHPEMAAHPESAQPVGDSEHHLAPAQVRQAERAMALDAPHPSPRAAEPRATSSEPPPIEYLPERLAALDRPVVARQANAAKPVEAETRPFVPPAHPETPLGTAMVTGIAAGEPVVGASLRPPKPVEPTVSTRPLPVAASANREDTNGADGAGQKQQSAPPQQQRPAAAAIATPASPAANPDVATTAQTGLTPAPVNTQITPASQTGAAMTVEPQSALSAAAPEVAAATTDAILYDKTSPYAKTRIITKGHLKVAASGVLLAGGAITVNSAQAAAQAFVETYADERFLRHQSGQQALAEAKSAAARAAGGEFGNNSMQQALQVSESMAPGFSTFDSGRFTWDAVRAGNIKAALLGGTATALSAFSDAMIGAQAVSLASMLADGPVGLFAAGLETAAKWGADAGAGYLMNVALRAAPLAVKANRALMAYQAGSVAVEGAALYFHNRPLADAIVGVSGNNPTPQAIANLDRAVGALAINKAPASYKSLVAGTVDRVLSSDPPPSPEIETQTYQRGLHHAPATATQSLAAAPVVPPNANDHHRYGRGVHRAPGMTPQTAASDHAAPSGGVSAPGSAPAQPWWQQFSPMDLRTKWFGRGAPAARSVAGMNPANDEHANQNAPQQAHAPDRKAIGGAQAAAGHQTPRVKAPTLGAIYKPHF